jgi:hypothetical protein
MISYKRYPAQVTVIKQFTSGHLEGMGIGEHMGFMTVKDAVTWAESVSKSPRTNYKVITVKDINTGEIYYGSD